MTCGQASSIKFLHTKLFYEAGFCEYLGNYLNEWWVIFFIGGNNIGEFYRDIIQSKLVLLTKYILDIITITLSHHSEIVIRYESPH